jgi:hypothetical protein
MRGRRHGLALVAGATVLALTLGACGSSSSSTSTSTSTTTTTPVSQIQGLGHLAQSGENATFAATWTTTSKGTTTTLSLAQDPPKSYFKVGSAVVINDGRATYYCASSTICVKESGVNPLADVMGVYDGQEFVSTIQGYDTAAILKLEGIDLSFHDATYGGLASTCVDIAHAGHTATWCVAHHTGILTYWAADGDSFTLTSYSSSPPASDFRAPKNVTTIP